MTDELREWACEQAVGALTEYADPSEITAVSDALLAAKEEQLEADCAECCSMCARGMPVREAFGARFWHGNEEGERCRAAHIRAASTRKGAENG